MTPGKDECQKQRGAIPKTGARVSVECRRILLWRPPGFVSVVSLLALLYLAAWGPLLLSRDGVWWDDWTLVNSSPNGIATRFAQYGLPWVGSMHVFLLQFGPVVYHVISMTLFFLTGLVLSGILATFPGLSPGERLFVTALFLLLPLNAARNTMIVLPYTVSLFLFYLAWYFLIRTERRPRLGIVFAGGAFFVSFSMNSLLVFYLLPMLHLWWRGRTLQSTTLPRFLKAWWPLLILPLVFFAVRMMMFLPSGVYEGVNSFSRFGFASASLLLALTATPFMVLWSERATLSSLTRRVWLLVFGGLALIALAVFPYVAIGHRPRYSEWSTRYEILMPLGVAVVILAAARLLAWQFGRRLAAAFAISVVGISIVLSARIGLAYWNDWRKQQAIVALLGGEEIVREGSTIVFQDKTVADNVWGVPYAHYAWTGLLNSAFGDSRRIGLNPSDVSRYLAGDYARFYGPGNDVDYGASNYVETDRVVIVTIQLGLDPGTYTLSTETVTRTEWSASAIDSD